MLNVLMISNNLTFVKYVINNISEIKIHRFSSTVREALSILENDFVDLILLNLPDNNILKFLEAIEHKLDKKYLDSIIVVLNKASLASKINSNPYVYSFITKDNYNKLTEIISSFLSLHSNNKNDDIIVRTKIMNELQYLGYNLSYVGTKYIFDVIYIMNRDYSNSIPNIKQNIYPILFEKYNKSYNNIKANMSKATEIMYYECDEEKLSNYLNVSGIHEKPRPTDIINTVLSKIHLD